MHLIVGGIINTFTDFGVVLLPLPTVLSLKINRRQQVMLAGLFGAGFAICLAGVFRIYFEFKSMSTFDRTWESFGLWIAGVIELFVGIVSDILNNLSKHLSNLDLHTTFIAYSMLDLHFNTSLQAVFLPLPTGTLRVVSWHQPTLLKRGFRSFIGTKTTTKLLQPSSKASLADINAPPTYRIAQNPKVKVLHQHHTKFKTSLAFIIFGVAKSSPGG